MRNQGHVTVFLSIILISMLLLGLSVLEMARIRMGSAKAAMAAEGAACDVKALKMWRWQSAGDFWRMTARI